MELFVLNNIPLEKYQGVLMPYIPPDEKIDFSEKDIKSLLKSSGAYFIRWVSNWDCKNPTKFWYLIRNDMISLEELSKNTRHNVRRGLKRSIILRVQAEYIALNGYDVYQKAFRDYETFEKPLSKKKFKETFMKYENDSTSDFWAVFTKEDSKLIGFSRNIIQNKTCQFSITKFDPQYLRNYYPSEAIFYRMIEYYLNEKNYKYVSDGARSVYHKSNVQDYLTNRFDFRKAYCKLNVHYSYKISFIVKLLYPFKNIIEKINLKGFQKIYVLLMHEEIIRSYE